MRPVYTGVIGLSRIGLLAAEGVRALPKIQQYMEQVDWPGYAEEFEAQPGAHDLVLTLSAIQITPIRDARFLPGLDLALGSVRTPGVQDGLVAALKKEKTNIVQGAILDSLRAIPGGTGLICATGISVRAGGPTAPPRRRRKASPVDKPKVKPGHFYFGLTA